MPASPAQHAARPTEDPADVFSVNPCARVETQIDPKPRTGRRSGDKPCVCHEWGRI